ncbi:MAG: DUF4301 family protein [Candidatus Delongbacteria bacterium]|nr:DUF4301 family protein [Candidatus Delongbacteria bacterium]MBN2836370.1 DUF4301 family protein [Candidatus Delongbacteria bacterium]
MENLFNGKDMEIINAHDLTTEKLTKQIDFFKKGQQFVKLLKPATVGDGIFRFTENEIDSFIDKFEKGLSLVKVIKFVPASGAATRMFKNLLHFKNSYDEFSINLKSTIDKEGKNYESLLKTMKNLSNFAFYDKADEMTGYGIDFLIDEKKYSKVLSILFDKEKMNLSAKPKAFIEFHKYEEEVRTALEEHIVEGINYTKSLDGNINLHFTISKEHENEFLTLTESLKQKYGEYKLNIEHSFQNPATDTIAVNPDNTPFRGEDGKIVLRPAGHGALLSNLNDLEADMVFIKNIDNVVPDKLKETTYRYKKFMGGLLMEIKENIHELLFELNSGNYNSEKIISFIKRYYDNDFELQNGISDEEKFNAFYQFLNRPVRICGMVKNEQETGGGPFWIEYKGNKSLQIIESAQIDRSIKSNDDMIKNSTHFNPVDIVYSSKDFEGDFFNLENYVDNDQAFISEKSQNGKNLKALELPGLWNGSMADWLTIFVEVPLITFNPVKEVNDLLKEEHQA